MRPMIARMVHTIPMDNLLGYLIHPIASAPRAGLLFARTP